MKIVFFLYFKIETVFEPPAEGFLTIKEQEDLKYTETVKQMKEIDKRKRKEGLMRVHEQKQEEAEEKARLAREKLKERRVVDDIPEPVYAPIIEPENSGPYGRWQTVKQDDSAPVVDLQLPQLPEEEYIEVPVEYEPEPEVKEFKEKTVESLGSGSATFKKRKIGSGAKRNTRQRLDDD